MANSAPGNGECTDLHFCGGTTERESIAKSAAGILGLAATEGGDRGVIINSSSVVAEDEQIG
jgi:hypothetical protein